MTTSPDQPQRDPDSAAEALFAEAYDAVRELADRALRDERAGHTLQATALVHEAYLKLAGQQQARWRDRNHFLAVAAGAIRRILVDHARSRARHKRGGGRQRLTLSGVADALGGDDVDLLDLEEALRSLEAIEPLDARIVELRYFAGLSLEDVATTLDLNERTVRRRWEFTRAWLFRELHGGSQESTP